MITLHHIVNSRSQRIIWLLEELNIPYQITFHHHTKNHQTIDSLKTIHPLGKAPIIEHNGFILAESGAIAQYLMQIQSNHTMASHQTKQHLQEQYWCHFSEATLTPLLILKLVFKGIIQNTPLLLKPIPWALSKGVDVHYIHPNIRELCLYMEQHLTIYPWFGGDEFGIADVLMSFGLQALSISLMPQHTYPNIDRFLNTITQRPAYQQALLNGQFNADVFTAYWQF